jgi:hypothetical protein
MRTRAVLEYAAAGAATGALAGFLAAAALWAHGRSFWAGLACAALAGAVVAGAGALALMSRRAALRDTPVGVVLGGVIYALTAAILTRLEGPEELAAVGYVACALGFSYAVGLRHAESAGRPELRHVSGFFAAIAGLVALAVGIRLVWASPSSVSTLGATAAGAIYGAATWAGVAVARRVFSKSPEIFRVR